MDTGRTSVSTTPKPAGYSNRGVPTTFAGSIWRWLKLDTGILNCIGLAMIKTGNMPAIRLTKSQLP